MIRVSQATPEEYVLQQLSALNTEKPSNFAVVYSFDQYYLPEQPSVELLALVSISYDGAGQAVWSAGVGRYSEVSMEQRQQLEACSSEACFQAMADELNWPWFCLDAALPLQPISIKKPWGQEVWFTGIEARGQSFVGSENRLTLLPWVLSIAPQRLTGGLSRKINLLKILDPLPEEVFGDLYFELHEKKQEVYVVTNINELAWPSGVGGIRFGFDSEILQTFDSDEAFKQAFAKAVADYELVRRQIDNLMDEMRATDGVQLNEPVMASQTKAWLESVPDQLLNEELRLRVEMDAFKGFKPLTLGDVVTVPCFTPHSLLHGVRTIEFQTPVYERQILTFAQKVLTQERWDTAEALECVQLKSPKPEPLKRLAQQPGVLVDEVVCFDDFEVWRVSLSGTNSWSLPDDFPYALLMGLSGKVAVGDLAVAQEQGAILPGLVSGQSLNALKGDATFLLALPR